MIEQLAGSWNYIIVVILMMTGLFMVIARANLVKKMIGLSIFQTSVFIFYISPKSAKTWLFEWLWSGRCAWLSAAYSGKQCWSCLANANCIDCPFDPTGNPSWLAIRRA